MVIDSKSESTGPGVLELNMNLNEIEYELGIDYDTLKLINKVNFL